MLSYPLQLVTFQIMSNTSRHQLGQIIFEDFSFSDTSMSYGVTARFIGRVHPIEQEFEK